MILRRFGLFLCGSTLALAQTSQSGVDLSAMDPSVSACQNFYQYACGTWMKNNPIPSDQARWGRFGQLQERNRDVLHEILEEAAKPAPNRDQATREIGDFYAAWMDEKGIEARGTAPLKPYLARIAAVIHSGPADLRASIASSIWRRNWTQSPSGKIASWSRWPRWNADIRRSIKARADRAAGLLGFRAARRASVRSRR